MRQGNITPSKKLDDVFLADLRDRGNVTLAAKVAGYARSSLYERIKEDPSFAQAVDDARAEYQSRLELEADRRAVEGVEKPVFYQGEVCGHVREYSDNLLMFRLKRLDPGYRDRVEHMGEGGGPVMFHVVTGIPRAPDDGGDGA